MNPAPHNSPAVVAEDLRALAETVPFDEATRELLELAAELIDPKESP